MGVFALVRNEHQHPHLILQFAINKQGILRGNYTDDVSGQPRKYQTKAGPSTRQLSHPSSLSSVCSL